MPEAQNRCRENQQLCIPTRLCNQPYHWFTPNFIVKFFGNRLSILASMTSSVTYTTWIHKNILVLNPRQEFATYATIHIDQNRTDHCWTEPIHTKLSWQHEPIEVLFKQVQWHIRSAWWQKFYILFRWYLLSL